jgi:Na+-translocating ferredoxin:NAD+ oxidoreductase RNF subunit RnfB
METNYQARIDPNLCTGCEDCVALCQMDALVPQNDMTAVDTGRCIGCGVCITACGSGALSLVPKQEPALPYKNKNEMYRKMMLERYGVIGTLKLMGKALLGQKI